MSRDDIRADSVAAVGVPPSDQGGAPTSYPRVVRPLAAPTIQKKVHDMDAQTDRHGGDDPVAHDIESRNPDSGGGPIEGVPEGDPESTEERRDGADERTDPAAPPAQEPPG